VDARCAPAARALAGVVVVVVFFFFVVVVGVRERRGGTLRARGVLASCLWMLAGACSMSASWLSVLVALAASDLSGFASLPADPPPSSLTNRVHYWVGNENHLDVFRARVVGRGGVHVGVGAEQNWVLAGWSRAEVVVPMDFDQAIVDLHRVTMAALRTAPTRDGFWALWREPGGKALAAAVARDVVDEVARAGALRALQEARALVVQRLDSTARRFAKRGVAWFLSDDEEYAWVRGLVLQGRVFPVRGDLTKQGTLVAIGAATRTAGLALRTLYLSNAEEYFPYGPATRASVASLPFDAESIVLHTMTATKMPLVVDDTYHYCAQTGASYAALLQEPGVQSVVQLPRWGAAEAVVGVTFVTATTLAEARAVEREKIRAALRATPRGPMAEPKKTPPPPPSSPSPSSPSSP
jgi:hypothetical protein